VRAAEAFWKRERDWSTPSSAMPEQLERVRAQSVGNQSLACMRALLWVPRSRAAITSVSCPAHTSAVPRVPPSQMECFPPMATAVWGWWHD
jgi:hypothetical protein